MAKRNTPSEDEISERNIFSAFFSLNFTDIPYNSDSHKILGLVYVKYFLSKRELILTTVVTFVEKGAKSVDKVSFPLIIQYTNVICGLKLLLIDTEVATHTSKLI